MSRLYKISDFTQLKSSKFLNNGEEPIYDFNTQVGGGNATAADPPNLVDFPQTRLAPAILAGIPNWDEFETDSDLM